MYHVSAQGVDERMINIHYYYYLKRVSKGIYIYIYTHTHTRARRTEVCPKIVEGT